MQITEEYLMEQADELGPVNMGRIPWKIITKPMFNLLGKGWTMRQIFVWLQAVGVALRDEQFENFKVHGYRKVKAQRAAFDLEAAAEAAAPEATDSEEEAV